MKIIRIIIFIAITMVLGNAVYASAYVEAYFPYNPRMGITGFNRFLTNQTLGRKKSRTYVTDLSHVTERYGLMIWISDPDATIRVMRYYKDGKRPTEINLETLEVTSEYKIVDVMDPTLEKILVIVTSPNKNSRFSINIMAICE